MKLHSTREQVDEVRKQVEHFGYKVHSIEGEERVVIGVVGIGDVTACLESVEAILIRKALQRFQGNVSQAAEALGLSRGALYRRMEKYGL